MICLATKQLGVLKRSFELVLQYSCVQDEIEIFKLLLLEEKERRGESGEALGATKKKKAKHDNLHMVSKSQKRLEYKENVAKYRIIERVSISMTYRKVPKVTTLITFGFSSLFLSLLSEGRYFQVAKTCIVHGLYDVTMIL